MGTDVNRRSDQSVWHCIDPSITASFRKGRDEWSERDDGSWDRWLGSPGGSKRLVR